MEYQELIQSIADLDFIENEETADAAIKAAFGIIVSMMGKEDARAFTQDLPDLLTLEKLRSHQVREVKVTPEQYIEEIATQFNLNEDDAREVVHTILHTTKQNLADEKVEEWKEKLPDQWVSFIENA